MKKIIFLAVSAFVIANADVSTINVDLSLITKDKQIIDIRTPAEWENTGTIDSAYKISFTKDDKITPNENFLQEISKSGIDTNKTVYIICQSGKRGAKASKFLSDNGFKDVVNLDGGMKELIQEGFKPTK